VVVLQPVVCSCADTKGYIQQGSKNGLWCLRCRRVVVECGGVCRLHGEVLCFSNGAWLCRVCELRVVVE
jgi:hypothetical protein